MPCLEASSSLMHYQHFSYQIWTHICQASVRPSPFPSLCPWMPTGSDETTLLSLFLCGQKGKEWREGRGRVWRNFVVDLQVQLPAPPTFLHHPPGSFLPWPVGCRWDTLGSTPSSEPTQMAAGIPLGNSGSFVVSKQKTMRNAVRCPIYELLINAEQFT